MKVKGQAKEVQGTGTHHIETDHLCVCVERMSMHA